MAPTISDQDKAVLRLAVATYKYPAARERDAREQFGMSGIRFWQEVNRIMDAPEAHQWDPHALARLKSQRVQRDRPRVAGRIL